MSAATAGPGSRARRAARVAVGVGLVGVVISWLVHPVQAGDTGPLLAGTEQLGRCLAALDLTLCDQTTPIGPYPVVQYLPDLVADAVVELSEPGRRRVFSLLSGLGVVVAVVAAWGSLRRIGLPEWRWGLLLLVTTGPMLAYGSSTWGEMPAAALLTFLVVVTLAPARPELVGLAALGAGLTKETGYPFVAVLGLVGLFLARRRTGQSIRRHVLLGAAGLSLALALASAFNLLRFGTPRNAYYLDPALRTESPGWFLELAFGLFVSPNGGILVFWPLAAALVGLLLVVPVAKACRDATLRGDAWLAVALTAIVLALTGGLAAWWAPFGWWAWGPRLSLPWVLPVALLSLAAFGSTLTPLAERALASTRGMLVAVVLLVTVALPHVGFLQRADEVTGGFFLRETAVCPGGGPPPTPAYYDCLHEELWTRHPIWLDALSGVTTPGGLATAAAVAMVVVGSLVLFRIDAGAGDRRQVRAVPYRQRA